MPPDSRYRAIWLCSKVSYHIWPSGLANRGRFPRCPFCPGGDRTHFKDSVFTLLKKNNLLKYLNKNEHEKAKTTKPGSADQMRYHCRNCGEESPKHYKQFIQNFGCRNCNVPAQVRRERRVAQFGSVADHTWLRTQYCYEQPNIDSTTRNPLPPEEVPISYTVAVNWICTRGHITTATPKHRYEGQICRKCSYYQTSRTECLLFIHLRQWLSSFSVSHRAIIHEQEVDILIENGSQKLGIEFDGKYFHRNKARVDRKKDITLHNNGVELIRVREKGLRKLKSTPHTIIWEQKPTSKSLDCYRELNSLVAEILTIAPPKINSFKHYDEALSYFHSLVKIAPADSAAMQFPHLIHELDNEHTNLNLEQLLPSAEIELPWHCPNCECRWTTTLYKRTIEKTGCPGCANQVVTSKNCIKALYPNQAPYFDLPSQFVPGSAQNAQLVCSYPHRMIDGKWLREGEICAKRIVRKPVNVFLQLQRQGHIWNESCAHPGHSRVVREKRKNRILSELGLKLWNRLPKYVQSSLLEGRPKGGIRCPKCGRTTPGMAESTLLSFILTLQDFRCLHCLGSGVPINPNRALNRGSLFKALVIVDTLVPLGWTIKNSNYLGISYSEDGLRLSATSPQGHRVSTTIGRWKKWVEDPSMCPCQECGRERARRRAKMVSLEKSRKNVRNRLENWCTQFKELFPKSELEPLANGHYRLTCGKIEKHHGISLPHPHFEISDSALSLLIKQPETLCPVCAMSQGKRARSYRKTVGFAQYLWKLHGSMLGQVPLMLPHPEGVEGADCNLLIDSRTQKLIARCDNPLHKISSGTYDNLLRRSRRGYCTDCLIQAGVENIGQLPNIVS